MKAEVLYYETKEDYIKDIPSTEREEYYSITEALADCKAMVRKIRHINSMRDPGEPREFIAYRILDSLGDVKWNLPSEPVSKKYMEQVLEREKRRKMAELREEINAQQKV
jgi:hypothetical protein